MTKEEKVIALEKYLERQRNMLQSPSETRKGDVEFEAWLRRDIARTEKRIKELRS